MRDFAMARVRLDTLLTERGLFESRNRAAAAIMAGEVHLGPGRRKAEKPGQMVALDIDVELDSAPRYVSRGGIKLANALDTFGLAVTGRCGLDVGASTGGFTDCLLQRGAARVIAQDVAYGELHWKLRGDPRVIVLERSNARSLHAEDLPYRPELVVMDVSFISLSKVLPSVLGCVATAFDCLAMVKPQFEVGRGSIARGGVVREVTERRRAVVDVASAAVRLGASVQGLASSGLPGPSGNRETFLWLAEGGRPGALADVAATAAQVDC